MLAPAYQPIQQVVKGLRRMRRNPPIGETLDRLEAYRANIVSVWVLAKHAPHELPGTLAVEDLLAGEDEGDDLIWTAMNVLSSQLPLMNDDLMAAGEYEDDGSHPLYIDPQGVAVAPDEFFEIISNPDIMIDNHSVGRSLLIFAMLLTNDIGDDEIWQSIADRCRWPVYSAPVSDGYDAEYPNGVAERLFAALKADRLPMFISVFRIAWFDTGSVFLDYNDEDAYTDPFGFDYRSIERLYAEWAKAQPFLDDLRLAQNMVDAQPEILQDIAQIWKRCCAAERRGKPRPKPNQTLIDAFAGRAGEDGEGD